MTSIISPHAIATGTAVDKTSFSRHPIIQPCLCSHPFSPAQALNKHHQVRQGWTQCRRQLVHPCRASTNTLSTSKAVDVTVEVASNNSRRLHAGVDIAAPVSVVWSALTDYDDLDKFIPGLAENRCLTRGPTGCRLKQVGEQEIALGAKFRAAVVLDIQEHVRGFTNWPPNGLQAQQDAGTGGWFGFGKPREGEEAFPEPRSSLNGAPSRDITFRLVEGDFQLASPLAYCVSGSTEGLLIFLSTPETKNGSCRLSYALFVRPQVWLPVRLIQNRIEVEVARNLSAVQTHSEKLFQQRKGQSNCAA